MVRFNTYILYDGSSPYTFQLNGNGLSIDVYTDSYFYKATKLFKKYVSYILYTDKGQYKPEDYDIYLYDPYRTFFWQRYVFSYYGPLKKLKEVEIFYPHDDKRNDKPLVVGFVHYDVKDTVYYTYKHLNDKQVRFELPKEGSFTKDDLISRLTEELGIHEGNKYRKLLFKLEVRPPNYGTTVKYHDSGVFAKMVTVSKSTYNHSFDKYEHLIDPSLNVTSFYLFYDKKPHYIDGENRFRSVYLRSVEIYCSKYDNKCTTLILGFIPKRGKKSYYTPKEIFTKSVENLKLETLKEITEAELEKNLETENDTIDTKVSYIIQKKEKYSYKIEIDHSIVQINNNTYNKYTHKPSTEYQNKISKIIYNKSKLMITTKKDDGSIDRVFHFPEQVLSKVIVYFGTKDPNTPLIIDIYKYGNTVPEYYNFIKSSSIQYWEKWNRDSKSQLENNKELGQKLKEGESLLSTSVFLIINKKIPYGKTDIENNIIEKLTLSQPETITVSENDNIKCLKIPGFKCYEHSLNNLTNIDSSQNNSVLLKPLIQTYKSNTNDTYKYGEIDLYNSRCRNLEFIYYEKNHTKFSVYFYGTDPRPLMICYAGNVFRPKDLDNYLTTWIQVDNITKCPCENDDGKSILTELKRIYYLINPVNLKQSISKNKSTGNYTIQSFYTETADSHIKIDICCSEMGCYKKYIHNKSNKYPLGEISHNNWKLFDSFEKYKKEMGHKFKFPTSVVTYYYIYDLGHDNPLLIVLEYGNDGNSVDTGSTKEYYRLNGSGDSVWSKLEATDNLNEQEHLENKLRDIKNDLGLYFVKTEENLIISSSDNCHEGSVAGPVAGTVTTLGLAGAGIGFGYYLRPDIFIGIYRRLI